MNHVDMNALIDELLETWAEVGRLLEARGKRIDAGESPDS